MSYDEFVAKQRARGLDQRSLTLTTDNTRLVTASAVTLATWGTAIEITPPAGQEISIRGKVQVRKDTQSAHCIYFHLADSGATEISAAAPVEMRIERTSRDQIQGPAGGYEKFNNITERDAFRSAEGIYLRGNDTLAIRVKPNITIDEDQTILNLEVDLWT